MMILGLMELLSIEVMTVISIIAILMGIGVQVMILGIQVELLRFLDHVHEIKSLLIK